MRITVPVLFFATLVQQKHLTQGQRVFTQESFPNAFVDQDRDGIDSIRFDVDICKVANAIVSVDIEHTFIGDLGIFIEHNGVTANIFDEECSSESNLFATFDDSAPLSVSDACDSPTAGTFHPEPDSLSLFNGLDASGDWTLLMEDSVGGNDGFFLRWELKIECECDPLLDSDRDGVDDCSDNCQFVWNPCQEDSDLDGFGDACEICLGSDGSGDSDGDGICDDIDVCKNDFNPGQEDGDSDGVGDLCDPCIGANNVDTDGDGLCDDADDCPLGDEDLDNDGVCSFADNCPDDFNPGQEDTDGDGIGDACDPCQGGLLDSDEDGVCDDIDNCVFAANPDQLDSDGDSVGDACDNCVDISNQDQADGDFDGFGDACDNCPISFDCTNEEFCLPTSAPTTTTFPSAAPSEFPSAAPSEFPSAAPTVSSCTTNVANACEFTEDPLTGEPIPSRFSVCIQDGNDAPKSECLDIDQLEGVSQGQFLVDGKGKLTDSRVLSCGCCDSDPEEFCPGQGCPPESVSEVCDVSKGKVKVNGCVFKKGQLKDSCVDPFDVDLSSGETCGFCP